MPFETNGVVFDNVAGASSAAAGQTVQSATWNAIHMDYEAALTQLNSQYATVNTNRNILWMNGGLEVWQRGAGASASIAIPGAVERYSADRWYLITDVFQVSSVSAVAGLVNESYRAAKVQRGAGQTGTTQMSFCYPIDTDELARMRGEKVTISALLRSGANWSATNVTVKLYVGEGSPTKAGNNGGNFSSVSTPISVTTALTANNSIMVTGISTSTVPTNITQAELQISWTPTGTAGVDDSITVDDVALEVVTTTYSEWTIMAYDRVPFAQMLEGCKRFYQKTFPYSVAPANAIVVDNGAADQFTPAYPGEFGAYNGVNETYINWDLPVELRRVITDTEYTVYNPVNAAPGTAYSTFTATNLAEVGYVSLGPKIFSLKFAALAGNHSAWAHFTLDAGI